MTQHCHWALKPHSLCFSSSSSSGELIPGLFSGFRVDTSCMHASSITTLWIMFTFWLSGSWGCGTRCFVYTREDPEEMRMKQLPVCSVVFRSRNLVWYRFSAWGLNATSLCSCDYWFLRLDDFRGEDGRQSKQSAHAVPLTNNRHGENGCCFPKGARIILVKNGNYGVTRCFTLNAETVPSSTARFSADVNRLVLRRRYRGAPLARSSGSSVLRSHSPGR